MKVYNEYTDETQWFCQGKGDIIFFALINSNKLSPRFFPWLKPNEDMEEKSPEEKILFELKVLTVWAFITGCFPFKLKETFYTIYTAFMHLTENKAKLEESLYRKKILFYEKKIEELYDFFAEHELKPQNDETWNVGKHIKLKMEDFTSLEDLPYKSLVCIEKKHWGVYLKADGDSAVVIDSKICNEPQKIPIATLQGQKIIKPTDIEIDYNRLESLLDDLNPNPYEILDMLKRQEFSQKITECICKIDQISFTEHDYNRFVKQAKSTLEQLDKEHYKNTYL